MTELDTIKRAKMYLEKLSCGIDPLTDTPIPPGEVAATPRMQKCFQYVTGLLTQIIDHDGRIGVIWTEDVSARYTFPEAPVTITEFVRQMNALVEIPFYTKLCYRHIVHWLLSIGAMEEVERSDGKYVRVPTEQGMSLGIHQQTRTGRGGRVYTSVVYDQDAQQFLLDNLETILTFANAMDHTTEMDEKEDG